MSLQVESKRSTETLSNYVTKEEPTTLLLSARKSLGRVVLHLVLALFQLSQWISQSVNLMRHRLLFMPINAATPYQQVQSLQAGGEELKKAVPKHICLAVMELEKVNLDDLSRLAVWCHALGVKFISFFDTAGVIQQSPQLLRDRLQNKLFESRLPKDSIVFLYPNEKLNCSYLQGDQSLAHVFQLHDGQEKLSDVVGAILSESIENKGSSNVVEVNYSVKEIEEKLCIANQRFPDPECVLCFGSVDSTMGLLPWQMNHTEIIRMDSHVNILPSQFLQALERYTKIEKRFGK